MADDEALVASALQDFQAARRRADLRRLLNQLSGEPTRLLRYDDVRRRLRAVESGERRREDVPLDAIVGSVGRYDDFTREFLPRRDSDRERWVGVNRAMSGLTGVPPIELYRIGDAYFVRDGNHRVSVARQMGARTIEAYVTPVHTRVPFSPEDDPEDLIIKSGYSAFLDATHLDELRPGADLSVSEAGAYATLREHISVHRWFMGIDEDREIPYPDAVTHWYDEVYAPLVDSIRASGILRGFPGRTETDLYLWLADHRARVQEALGWELPGQQVVQGLAGGHLAGARERGDLLRRLSVDEEARAEGQLADDLLVAFEPGAPGLRALDQALLLASRERARVYGLRVLAPGASEEDERRAREAFESRCRAADVPGQLAFEEGDAVATILDRGTWVDVVIAAFEHEGGSGSGGGSGDGSDREAHLASRVRPLLRRSPRPLLAVTGAVTPLDRPLLAYDGGERAESALFAAVYVTLKWGVRPVVLTVAERERDADATLDRARTMFERYGARADYLTADGPVADAIVRVVRERDRDVVLMGSHSRSRWVEEVFGGVLEPVLREVGVPVLIL